jgi:hypothetical protein
MEGHSQQKLQATVTTWKEANTDSPVTQKKKKKKKKHRSLACQAKQAKHMSFVHQLKA